MYRKASRKPLAARAGQKHRFGPGCLDNAGKGEDVDGWCGHFDKRRGRVDRRENPTVNPPQMELGVKQRGPASVSAIDNIQQEVDVLGTVADRPDDGAAEPAARRLSAALWLGRIAFDVRLIDQQEPGGPGAQSSTGGEPARDGAPVPPG